MGASGRKYRNLEVSIEPMETFTTTIEASTPSMVCSLYLFPRELTKTLKLVEARGKVHGLSGSKWKCIKSTIGASIYVLVDAIWSHWELGGSQWK